ncbi:MAG: hypothetical protein QGG33_04310, partial [Candidatus Krumholzibacteria bacterium]|nr:hypothetical protein [Candidatus Krumholzibacteria bacterium]
MKNIWRFLSDEAKERVLDDVISIEDPEFDAHIRGSLASAMRFRSVFIKRKSASELRRLLKDNFHRLGESGLYLLTQTYILARSSLVGQLYDSQGIPHDNAEVTEDLESIAPLNPDQMKEVIQQLSEDHPLEDVWLCFAIISRSGFSEWRDGAGKIAGNLETKLRSESRSEKEEGPKKTVQTQKGDQPPGKPPLEELPEELIAPTFSSLDELLISTMVSTMNEVEGAICPDKL